MLNERDPLKADLRPAIDLVSITQGLLVAEYLSFRRVANVLGVRQSAVSRRVRSLEDVLGVSLFERYHGGVRITAAGAQFFDKARDVLIQLNYAVKTAGAAGCGAVGRLNIGILSSMSGGFLREAIRQYRTRHPDVAIQILEGTSIDHIARVRNRSLDVAFVAGTPAVPNCEVTHFWTERLFVALPQAHALCEREQIEWEALRDEHFIVRQSDPSSAMLIKRFSELGHRPSLQRFDVGCETLLNLVAIGLGVTLKSEATVATAFPDVVLRPIAGDADVLPFSAVWSPANDNPAFRRFLSLARVMSKQENAHSDSSATKRLSSGSTIVASISALLLFLLAHRQTLGLLT
jgi:DNA-binding transcriptional LysR family regulator